jgi:hypothetical protein
VTEHIDDSANLAMLMGEVARKLLGEPTNKHHGGLEWRYGTHGSLSIDLRKGAYFDHEAAQGGGVLDLIVREIGGDHYGAVTWLKHNRVIVAPPTKGNGPDKDSSHEQHNPDKTGAKPNGNSGAARRFVTAYDYVDEQNSLLFQAVRYDPKCFRQRRPDGHGGWIWNVDGVRQVPHRLPEIMKAIADRRTVFIVEGEKDADALCRIGIPATCNAGGAGKWTPELNQYFRDADVVILPDQDPQSRNKAGAPLYHADDRPKFTGQDHAKSVAAQLANIASRIRILDLPGVPPKGDASDWIEAGGAAADLFQLVESKSKPWAEYETPKGEDHPESATKLDAGQPSAWWRSKLIKAPSQVAVLVPCCSLRKRDFCLCSKRFTSPSAMTLQSCRPRGCRARRPEPSSTSCADSRCRCSYCTISTKPGSRSSAH